MKKSTTILTHWLMVLMVSFSLILTGCGSDSDNSSGSETGSSTLSGTAATGAALAGYIYIVDANGAEVNVATNSDGSYSYDVSGMTAPFMIRAIPDNTALDIQYSYAAAAGTANITPMTSLALFIANANTSLATLADASFWSQHHAQVSSNNLSATNLENAIATINANFASILNTQGLDENYNFFNQSFSANGTGIDAILDDLTINIDNTGGTFTVQLDGNSFSFNSSINIDNINDDSGNSDTGSSTDNNNDSSTSLPSGVAGQVITMEFCCAASGAPHNTGDQVLFNFSSSGALMLTEQNTVVSNSFTVDSFGQYVWTASEGTQYSLSLVNDAIHEVNVMSSTGAFLGQFAAASSNTGNNTDNGSVATSGNWTLTVTGTYNIAGMSINIPATTINDIPGTPTVSDVESAVESAYGSTGTVTVSSQIDTASQKQFTVSFSGTLSGQSVNYSLTYDYQL